LGSDFWRWPFFISCFGKNFWTSHEVGFFTDGFLREGGFRGTDFHEKGFFEDGFLREGYFSRVDFHEKGVFGGGVFVRRGFSGVS